MSLKDLFKEQNYKYLGNTSVNSLTSSGVESPEFIDAFVEDRDRFIPLVDYSLPENFARFGSAEKYYYDSITRVYNTYPYDGSKKEKIQWELSSSGLDLYLFENGYPRTNGFAVFSSASVTATDVSTDYTVWGSYGAAGSGTYEFVSFNGGPHAGEGSNIYVDPDTGEAHYRKDANLYDLSKDRECNLKIGGNDGNTVEFWLKKAAFNVDATQTEVLFDIFTTSSISSSVDYGRLTVEMSGHGAGTNTLSPFYVTYMSGTSGISKQNIGASLTTSSVADDNWHHYSFRFKNDGANTSIDLFVDGLFNHNVKAGTTVDYVSGTIVGTIGALATNPSGSSAGAPTASRGWGKLSGSLDEFRFWKVWRTSKQIQTRWFDQVGGGTNTDDANTHLGLYYKFNEGITQTASTDSNVLDYSGRVTNGSWNGYSSIYSRETGSAINDSGLTTYVSTEFLDPIIYSFHPEVISYRDTKRKEGKNYDYGNPSTLYYSLPSWIVEEHDANNPDNEGIIANSLWNLTQILSSHFDSTANLMKSLPNLRQNDYVSGSQKPIPFMSRILESKGFVAPEIFNALDALEYFENRDSNTSYEEKIANVKNIIYKNIYNNLSYINKSKGAEKSFRNLIRCFGINDEIYKLNYYSNNVDYILEDNFRSVTDKFKLINFNSVNNSDGSVFQYSSSLNPNSTTFISASNNFTFSESPEYSLPFSVEAGMIFPNRVNQSDYSTFNHNYENIQNDYPLMLTASLFGMHTARGDSPADTTWNTNDYANFVVKAVKPATFSDKAKFVLTGTAGGFIPELSSSFYDEVYGDTPWNFLFCLYPQKYLNANEVDGTENSPYVVEFSGMQKVLDETINQFTVTGSITAEEATKILASPKRVFVGAHRTNFTGSTLQQSDVKFNTVRVWQNKLDIKDLNLRGSDPNNYSIKNPEQNAYLFNESNNRVYVPNKETLLLHWNFNNVTGSDSSGEFIVEDLTSGSISEISRYGILSNLSNKQFTGLGFEFDTSSKNVVIIDDLVTAKPNMPEVLSNENTVNVMTNDDIYYTRDSRPTFFDLYVEKSAYQNISQEMLKFMATVTDFNDLIGHTVDRYRDEYKALSILRQAFFETMDAPNVEKYMEYFKWFDLAVSAMIQQLAPMSSGLGERPLRNIIESHVLERNKYQSKFPTYEFKQSDPEGRLFGINEMLYPWKEGHFPIETPFFNQQSLAFPGGGGSNTVHKADIGNQASLSFGADGTISNEPSFSISAWVYMTDVENFSIFSKGSGASMQYVLGTFGSGIMSFTLSDNNDSHFIGRTTSGIAASETVVQGFLNKWVHIVATYDGSRVPGGIKLYVNGSELATAATSGGGYSAMENLNVPAQIGRTNDQDGMTTSGFIDELAVMSVGLTATQVSELYNGGVTFNLEKFSVFNTFVSWWRLGDSKTGTSPNFTIPDLVGNNDVTMSNFTGNSTSGIVSFHAPSEYDQEIIQENNCLWAKERAERTLITGRNTEVDSDRQEILDVINNLNDATPPNFKGPNGTYQGSTYALRRFARPYKVNAIREPELHGGGNAHENKKVGFWDSIRKRPTQSTPGEGALISIEPPTSSLEQFKDCDDNLELNRGKRKFKFSAGVAIDGAEDPYEIYKGQIVFPFSLYSSSVDSNPAYADLADFQENLAITNLHHDNYGPFNDVPMQGPFTEKYVGGRSYRHVMTNFTFDNEEPDSEGERLEGWRLTGSAEGNLDLVNVDPARPKSIYFREEYAKRPVNIKNIKQLTSSLLDAQDQATDAFGVTKIGNYTNTYEIVMTSGRSINNRYLAESDGVLSTLSPESEYISGTFDFVLPRRDLTGSNKAIIVNRFSAPGDVSTMGEGFLDVAAAEFSPYNALPFRNLLVRQPLQEILADHTNQFGLFSDARTVADFALYNQFHTRQENYPGGSSSIDDPGAGSFYIGNDGVAGTGSFHKVNRNGRMQPKYSNEFLRDSGTVSITPSFDNFFVKHQIPQTDMQYAWITASIINGYTGSALFGFEQPDFSNASLASTDLTFVSASDSGSTNIKVDFVGLNTLVLDNVFSELNILSSSEYYNDQIESLNDALTTNAILLNRGGPAGGSSWKLYRKNDHPIVRAHRKENRLSFLKPVFAFNSEEKQVLIGGKGAINSVIEPPITSKYAQLSHRLIIKQGETEKEVTINHSYMNNIRFFTDHSSDRIDLDDSLLKPNKNTKTDQQMLDVINYYLYQASDFNNAEDYNPISGLISYTTRETIFPKEQYTYLATHRQRDTYQNSFWRDNPDDRRARASGTGSFSHPDTLLPQLQNPYGFVYFDRNNGASSLNGFFTGRFYDPAGLSASIWSMDARENYETNSPGRIASSALEAQAYIFFTGTPGLNRMQVISGTDGSGILQNALMPYSQVTRITGNIGGTGDDIVDPRPTNGFVFPQYNRRIAGMIGSDPDHEYKFGDTKWEAGKLSGKTPFYDTYSHYSEEIRRCGKDYGLIPEFRISNHMDFYLNEGEDGFLTEPINGRLGSKGFLEITGTALHDSADSRFAKTYSHTDFLKTFTLVEDLYGNETITSKITLSADALIKFLPYDGFYPAQRTEQLAGEFYNSYSASFFATGNIAAGFSYFGSKPSASFEPGETIHPEFSYLMNPIWKPLFAPGILYNSIKSGIAVDYPVHTAFRGFATSGSTNQRNVFDYLVDIPRIGLDFDFRVPFEALLDPEREFSGKLILESEPHPSASMNLTASLAQPGKINYKLAMNNFLASTIDFFKADGNLTTIASLADNDVKFGNQKDPFTKDNGFQVGKEYRMRIACYHGKGATTFQGYNNFLINQGTALLLSASFAVNPPSCLMYGQTGSVDPTVAAANNLAMSADYYGSAFGPPVSNESLLCLESITSVDVGFGVHRLFGSASYEPFTPAYYDGYSHMEFVFRPTIEDDFASLSDIFNSGKMEQTNVRFNTGFTFLSDGGTAIRNRMNLSASLNLAFVHKPTTVFDAKGNPIEVADAGTNDGTVFTIQPKWECPILNFKDVSPSLPEIGSGSVARGMWHQYGVKPSGSDGIFLHVQDLDETELDNPTMTGSLATQLGLSTLPRRLGTVAEKKKISEAIVAIPFFTDQNNTTKRFFIDRRVIDVAESIADTKQAGTAPIQNKIQPDDSVVDMVTKMKKFVIPPHLDFITNKTVSPFAMFIFDFEVELTEKDLTDIWQNLPPTLGTSFQKTQASLPVEVFSPSSRSVVENGTVVSTPFSLMKSLPENTRWMVFKVKQRSEKNYFTKTADSSDDSRFQFNFEFGSANAEKLSVPDYSYNWPFDFFSLVELAKIDAEIESITPEPSGKTFDKDLLDNILGVFGDITNAPKSNVPKIDLSPINQGVIGDPGVNPFAQPSGPAPPTPGGPATPAPGGSPIPPPTPASVINTAIFTTPISTAATGLSMTQPAMSPRFSMVGTTSTMGAAASTLSGMQSSLSGLAGMGGGFSGGGGSNY